VKLRHEHAILVLALALLVIGLGMVFSASFELARTKFGDGFFFLKRQAFRATVGVGLLLLASQIDFRQWRRWARHGLVIACGGLLLVFLFHSIRGARGWVQVFGRTFQPVEFARLALVVLLASEIARLGPRIRSLRTGLLPLAAVAGTVLGLVVLQPDFGSALAIAAIVLTLLFVGGARVEHLGAGAAVLLVGTALLAWEKPHVRTRFLGFLQPDAHAAGEAYQSLQSVMSIGAGGPFGKGLGQGFAKYGYLPDPHTDFIFSVMGEELGFIGCAVVLALFLFLVGRAIRVAKAHEDPFARLLAVGIGMSIFWYVAINLLVAVRLFPVTGLPLPLVSYGGSALVTHLFALGILRNLARQADGGARRATRFRVAPRHAVEGLL
jgi:cell division protein FtsW